MDSSVLELLAVHCMRRNACFAGEPAHTFRFGLVITIVRIGCEAYDVNAVKNYRVESIDERRSRFEAL